MQGLVVGYIEEDVEDEPQSRLEQDGEAAPAYDHDRSRGGTTVCIAGQTVKLVAGNRNYLVGGPVVSSTSVSVSMSISTSFVPFLLLRLCVHCDVSTPFSFSL